MATFYIPAIGVVDGVNTTFSAGRSYIAGTMFHHLNGSIKTPADTDGITETNPAAGLVNLKVAPRVGDRVILIVNDGVGTEITTGVSAVFRSTISVRASIQSPKITARVSCG